MAPLKLYANVTGKFTVERELGEKVQDKVRDRTLVAEKQRTERKAILLETPPDLGRSSATGKRRREGQVPRRPVHPADRNLPASSSAPPLRVMSPSQAKSPVPSARKRLIHCVALSSRTVDEAVRLVGGKDCDSTTRKQIIELLEEVIAKPLLRVLSLIFYTFICQVAERVPTPRHDAQDTPPRWQLKTQSWTEVRPYEWQKLDTSERTYLARQARAAFSRLKISETHALWDHVRYRNTEDRIPPTATASGIPESTVKPEARRGIISKETKQKKVKTTDGAKKKATDLITAKDESARPLREVVGKGKQREVGSPSIETPTPTSKPTGRRLPGSGFKVKVGSASATPPATQVSPASSQPSKRTGPVDVRDSRRGEVPSPSGPARPAPPIPPPAASQERKQSAATVARVQKKAPGSHHPSAVLGSDRERDRDSLASAATTKKRKRLVPDGESEYSERDTFVSAASQKRRKTDEVKIPREDFKERDPDGHRERDRSVSLPQKLLKREGSPLAAPRVKVKKEASPLLIARSPVPVRPSLPPARAPARDKAVPSPSSSSTSRTEPSRRMSGSVKPRRKSPIYTSSEDESSEPLANGRDRPRKEKYTPCFKALHSLPSDRAGLRKYYKKCFVVYIKLYNEKVSRRDQIERLLSQSDNTSVSVSDSEAETELDILDPDLVTAFAADLNAVTEEMKKVKQAWVSLGGKVDASGKLMDG